MTRLKGSVDGQPVIGTFDRLDAVALTFGFIKDDEGNIEPDYLGESKVLWDTQEVQRENGELLVVVEGGDIHRMSEVEWEEEDGP